MILPKLSEEGSSTTSVSSSTFLNMLNCEQISKNIKCLECIPDPDSDCDSESITLDPVPRTKSVEIKKKVIQT